MQALRRTPFLVRLVLTWFVLALGVAVASPVVSPKSMELVCSTGGAMKIVVTSADGSVSDEHGHTLDCPLCLTAHAAPLPELSADSLRPAEPSTGVADPAQTLPSTLADALPPSRAPPSSF